MNSAQVLTHPAFDRAPVPNAIRRGPTPRGIPMLSRERWNRRNELSILRRWADEHEVKPSAYGYDYDKIRELKAKHEAREVALSGPYGDELRDAEELRHTVVRLAQSVNNLYSAVSAREKRILEQVCRELVNNLARENNLPVRWD